jgi:hypothetical protein
MRRLFFVPFACSAVLFVATGCGGVRHTPVTGLVTLDGQPYGDVLITFIPANSTEMTPVGRADATGKFQMGTETPTNGVKPGKYKVTVVPGPPKDSKATGHPSEAFLKKAQPAAGKVDANKEYRKIEIEGTRASRKTHPTIYADPARTPLEVEVTNEPRDVKLELKSNAK